MLTCPLLTHAHCVGCLELGKGSASSMDAANAKKAGLPAASAVTWSVKVLPQSEVLAVGESEMCGFCPVEICCSELWFNSLLAQVLQEFLTKQEGGGQCSCSIL